tara:strand:- start:619 stop:894 length:276 start_codon:yes stop_codon:yes gene_type:complete
MPFKLKGFSGFKSKKKTGKKNIQAKVDKTKVYNPTLLTDREKFLLAESNRLQANKNRKDGKFDPHPSGGGPDRYGGPVGTSTKVSKKYRIK